MERTPTLVTGYIKTVNSLYNYGFFPSLGLGSIIETMFPQYSRVYKVL